MESIRVHSAPHPALLRALRRLLRPLVRLLVREGVTFPALAALLKELYVDVAQRDCPSVTGRQTDSRITLLTGVHRKDVKRLRDRGPEEHQDPPVALSLSAQIIAYWAGNSGYMDRAGAPLPLPRSAAEGPSFETLVTHLSKDIRPRAVLDDLMDRRLVHLDSEGRVSLADTALVPREGMDELAFFLGRNLHDHIAACDHNLAEREKAFIERAVYYDRLTPEAVARLEDRARELGMDALLSLNREASALADRDQDAPHADRRMSFGVYFYSPPNPQSEEG